MHNFLANNRDELIARCTAKVVQRPGQVATRDQLRNAIPLFLEQLRTAVVAEEERYPGNSFEPFEASGGNAQALAGTGVTAAAHGKQLLELGLSVDQIVHDYGDLCQAITELAIEQKARFSIDEYIALHRCLDSTIADTVTEFSGQRDADRARQQSVDATERLEFLVHELRNSVDTATIAVSALEMGNLPMSGATGSVLKRSLAALTALIDGTLDEVRITAGAMARSEAFSLDLFIADAEKSAALAARERGCAFTVPAVDPALAIAGNREHLLAALANLLQNAFKFTRPHTEVTLLAYTAGDWIFIEVHDNCGGLPAGKAEKMFKPFSLRNGNKTGLGLGLSMARQSVEADGGTLTVKNLAGTGCVFTISLPRRAMR